MSSASPESSPSRDQATPNGNSSASSVDNSTPPSKIASDRPRHQIATELPGLYSEAAAATVLKVATTLLPDNNVPAGYPEWVPQQGDTAGKYTCREVVFWTCGFFPGSLYTLLERAAKYPQYLHAKGGDAAAFHTELLRICRGWSAQLHDMAHRTNTHDLGFIVQPALRKDWEMTGNYDSLASLSRAAHNLASRYDSGLKAIRSWDKSVSKRYDIHDMETNFLVIVDSMCNIDLLYYVGHMTQDKRLIDIATDHAHFVRNNLIRPDNSTWHVVNVDPRDGSLKSKHTHQGYSDDSTWSRGQAWTILGFAQTYIWTKDRVILDTVIRLADHFLHRLHGAKHGHPYVPLWDFDAPGTPPRDSSAGMIAANGLLLLHQILGNDSPYLEEALRIATDTIAMCQTNKTATVHMAEGKIVTDGVVFDSILKHATANNNEYATLRYADHGLVYADYYFLEFGNQLLRMGMV